MTIHARNVAIVAAIVTIVVLAGAAALAARFSQSSSVSAISTPTTLSSTVLTPSDGEQSTVMHEPIAGDECTVFRQMNRKIGGGPCYIDATADMGQPASAGGAWKTGRASITSCLSRPTQRPSDTSCIAWVDRCRQRSTAHSSGSPRCSLLWYATATVTFQYDGKHLRRAHVNCGESAGLQIVVVARRCGAVRVESAAEEHARHSVNALAVGENFDVRAGTRLTSLHLQRLILFPDGKVRFWGQ